MPDLLPDSKNYSNKKYTFVSCLKVIIHVHTFKRVDYPMNDTIKTKADDIQCLLQQPSPLPTTRKNTNIEPQSIS